MAGLEEENTKGKKKQKCQSKPRPPPMSRGGAGGVGRRVQLARRDWFQLGDGGGGGESEGGGSGFSLLEETGFNWETWNVGWTFKDSGNLSSTADGLMTLTMGNGPIYLGDNLRDSAARGMFLVESQRLTWLIGRSLIPVLVNKPSLVLLSVFKGNLSLCPDPLRCLAHGKGIEVVDSQEKVTYQWMS